MEQPSEKEVYKTQLHMMLSRISHEIRNPVGLLSSQLQLMTDHHPELKDYEEWDNLEENMDYLTSLLGELSDYNNADTIRLESIEMEPFLRSVLSCARPSLNYLDISLHVHLDEQLPVIRGDRVKLRQVILNLLRNAQEAITPPGQIYLEAFCRNGHIFISMKDSGCGIPREYMDTLFDPFVTHKPGGTGLGLAIIRQIIEAHQGTVQAESIPGKGSTFTVILPVNL